MRLIGLTDLGSLPGILAPTGPIQKPVIERKCSFSEVLFAHNVFVPGDELDGGKLVYQGEIDIEIKGSILVRKGWIQRLFDHACLVSDGET